MSRPLLRLASAAAGVAAIAATVAPASSDTVAVYSIQTGRSIVLKTPNLERVAVRRFENRGNRAARDE